LPAASVDQPIKSYPALEGGFFVGANGCVPSERKASIVSVIPLSS